MDWAEDIREGRFKKIERICQRKTEYYDVSDIDNFIERDTRNMKSDYDSPTFVADYDFKQSGSPRLDKITEKIAKKIGLSIADTADLEFQKTKNLQQEMKKSLIAGHGELKQNKN